jgi:enoyl-CoA hydratase/carnithine racemase
MANPVRLQQDGALCVLTIDHPPLNLFDRALVDGLVAAVDRLTANPPRGLLIRASGNVVSGGVDVHLFRGMSATDAQRLFRTLLGIVDAVEQLPCPTVFAAHALTLTAAFELSLACDLIVAARSARFGLVEARFGITPGMGGTQRLAERAGHGRAREFVLTGDLYDAPVLYDWGVVNQVHPDERLAAEAEALARRLSDGPTCAHAVTKRILRAQLDGGTALADRLVPTAVSALYETEDLRNAVDTFFARGSDAPRFSGR